MKNAVIRSLLKDKNGNLWFGTYGGGVTKYDGKSFTHFTEKEGLTNNHVISILQDETGSLWFGTDFGGVSKYDGKNFTNFTEKEGLSNNRVSCILKDNKGNIWFGTDGGVCKYDGNRVEAINRGDKVSQETQQDLRRINGKPVKSFTHFTKNNGLCDNNVYSILQDNSGNLWFGTLSGVCKYDEQATSSGGMSGTAGRFTQFTKEENIMNYTVLSILQDKNKNLWFGTDGGVFKYNGNEKTAKYFTHYTEKEGLSNNIVRSILQDKGGNIWFGTYGGGLSKLNTSELKTNDNTITRFAEKEGLSSNYVFSILNDESGNFWIGTEVGLNKYDGNCFTHFTKNEGLNNNTILSISQDNSGNLWLGTYGGGVSKYDGKSFTHFTKNEGLSNNTVVSVLQDNNENYWFGTFEGVNKYDGKTFTHFTEKEGLTNNTVRAILQDKSGTFWFGTYGGGVSRYDGKCFTNFTEKEGLSNNRVNCIFQDKSENLWFGTDGGGVTKYEGLHSSTGGINKTDGTFTHFTEEDGLSNNFVLAIQEDNCGNLWFGTYGGGVCKYNGKNITVFTEKEGLGNNTVLSILLDKSGNLWLGNRLGLSKLTNEKIVEISGKTGSGAPYKGDVFFKNYTYEDGFLGVGVIGGKTICEDKKGTIWIGANDRLTVYHPEGDIADTNAPTTVLTGIELFNENIPWVNLEAPPSLPKGEENQHTSNTGGIEGSISSPLGRPGGAKDTSFTLGNGVKVGDFYFDGISKWYSLPENLSLAYNNNFLTFNYTGITQKSPEKVKYKYKLEGIDESWSGISNRTEAPYGNLPEGNYLFRVKAMNSEGYWSPEFNYKFTIRPPWWKTWWFRTLLAILIISGIAIYIKWRERALIVRQKQLEQTVEERTAEVKQEKKIVEEQKHLIEEKNHEISSSISYAKRIQHSFLTAPSIIKRHLPDHFILFKPRDVVSGDFYWMHQKDDYSYFCVADCTGHGIPGAFMSLIGMGVLNEIVFSKNILDTNDILNELRRIVILAVNPEDATEEGKDGMDLVYFRFHLPTKELQYSAANNSFYMCRKGELTEYKPDKMPVGSFGEYEKPFTQHTIQLEEGDIIYAITDGYADQFGGPKGKKFKYKQFEELLLSICNESMEIQKQKLNDAIENWKGDLEQVDDVTVVGIRI